MTRRYFDILAIIPLEEELKAFTAVFPEVEDCCTDRFYRFVVNPGSAHLSMMVVLQEDMGKGHASRAIAAATKDYEFGIAICLGIAGGLSKDLRLGDVCYTGSILDFYDNSKVTEDAKGNQEVKWSVSHHKTDRRITQALNLSRLLPGFKEDYEDWRTEREAFAKALAPEAHRSRKGEDEYFEKPNTFPGALACAAVTDSPSYNAKLLASDRRILAVETESGGIFEQAELEGLPCLTIRGISDYANPQKGELEDTSKGKARLIAASNCMSFLKFQLSKPRLVDLIVSQRLIGNANAEDPRLPLNEEADFIADTLTSIGRQVDEKLRELSPEYRLQLKGYKLPLPRIVPIESASLTASKTVPSDFVTVIDQASRMIVDVPRTYPDTSLPWILADDLLTAEIRGKQAVPIVIDGASLKLPNNGIKRICEYDLTTLATHPSVHTVVIIVDVPLVSKTRRNFVRDEISELGEASVICFVNGEVNVAQETDFISATGSSVYAIADISFRAISSFIEKNFEIEPGECQVIALRLKKTFGQFKLPAHPTFFAGIPREVLASLVQANRRAELIQLAVDGFLTFLVAGDPADIALSRTTRSRFLRQHVRATKLENKSLEASELIEFTKEFATKGDFEINADEFVAAFVDRGVLHFERGKVVFTLPFIESYLLAIELREDSIAALAYFDLSKSDFDILTFDLYAELGAHVEIFELILSSIKEVRSSLRLADGDKNILTTGSITPAFLSKQDRLQGLQRRIEQALVDVQDDVGNIEKKQRLLDVHDKVQSEATKGTRAFGDGTAENALVASIEEASRVWAIATMLLGAGAEHLDANQKRSIAAEVVSVAGLILHHWTLLISKIDFKGLKTNLISAEFIDKLIGDNETDQRRHEVTGTIEMMVDVLEFNALSEPVRRMMNFLCEEARQKVLGVSIAKAGLTGELDVLLQSIWLTDIDPTRGKPLIKEAVKHMSKAPFLRVNVANHMLTRAYWSHAVLADKKALLAAGNEALEVLGLNMSGRELQKMIMEGPPASDS